MDVGVSQSAALFGEIIWTAGFVASGISVFKAFTLEWRSQIQALKAMLSDYLLILFWLEMCRCREPQNKL